MARIFSDTGAQGLTPGGGIPTPNWDALADIDAVGGVTRADVVPRVVGQLAAEASNADADCIVLLALLCQSTHHFLVLITSYSSF